MGSMTFSDLITFTRSTGGGRFNANGQYEWLPANTPRIDYDPVTGECKGLLVEEQRTNFLTWSSDFSNAVWTKRGATIDSNADTSPSGTINADKLVESSTAGLHGVQRTVVAGVGSYSVSVRAKSAGRSSLRVYLSDNVSSTCFAVFNIDTGEVISTEFGANWTGGKAAITRLKDGWVECAVSANSTNATSSQKQVVINTALAGQQDYQGDGTSGIYIWGAQLEAGSFPTSCIPTEGAQVTRAADIATVNELSPWFNPVAGTLFVECDRGGNANWLRAAEFGTTTASYILSFQKNSAGGLSIYTARDNVVRTVVSTLNLGDINKFAAAWDAAGISGSVNGAFGQYTADANYVPLNLKIGQSLNSYFWSGHIRSIRYFPRRLSNTELQAITA